MVGTEVLDELVTMVGRECRRVALVHDGNLAELSGRLRRALSDAGYEVTGIPLVPPGRAGQVLHDGADLLGDARAEPGSPAPTSW